MKKISVIIPIYNAEKYLEECLNSIQKQNYTNYEVIMINDGSTDSSANICMHYVNVDARFKLINQENKGVSAARNNGINNVTGDYIVFIDSDDYISPELFNTIIENIKDNHLLCYGNYYLYQNKLIYNLLDKENNDYKYIVENIYLSNKICGYLWNKVFISSIIKENNLFFSEDIHYCEDLLFVTKYLDYCSKALYLNQCLYYYRMRKSSSTYSFENKRNTSILLAYEEIINKYNFDIIFKYKLEYYYLFYYYKLKKFLEKNSIKYNEEIISDYDTVKKFISRQQRIKLYFVKNHIKIFNAIKKIKNLTTYKLFE